MAPDPKNPSQSSSGDAKQGRMPQNEAGKRRRAAAKKRRAQKGKGVPKAEKSAIPTEAPRKGSVKKQRIKTARGRRASSTRWLERHLNDPYAQAAREQGYASRAVFKLEQIDDKYNLLKSGQTIIDLGAAPGGWSQYAALKTNINQNGRVLAIDLLEMTPLEGVDILQGDMTDPVMQQWMATWLARGKQLDDISPTELLSIHDIEPNQRADGLISDMAPNTTGHASTDHFAIMTLVEEVFNIAEQFLKPGGFLVTKTFQGGTSKEILDRMNPRFERLKHVKPPASRKESKEMFLVATGFRGVS